MTIRYFIVGGSYLNTLPGSKPNQSESETPVNNTTAVSTSQTTKKEVDQQMTNASTTETNQPVVSAQWEEEKVIQPVGQDYVEELRGGDGMECISL